MLWASEVWQRPLVMMEWDEGILLTIAIATFFVGGSAMILTRSRISVRRVFAVTVACGLVFLGIATMTHLSAVHTLMKHRNVQDAIYSPPSRAASSSWMDTISEWMNGPLMDSLDWILGSVDLSSRKGNHLEDQALDQLLESSRWRVRKAFIHAIMRDEDTVVVATRNWHRIFPAVVGQDVTLARRQEVLRDFTGIAQDASTTSKSRNAAIFWMGLIVATDMEAFEKDRPRVRDLMLSVDMPPISETGDVWMRVLNTLLSMDEPGEQAALAKRLIRDQALLRRAVRECVRGIEEWTEKIIFEIENLDDAGDSTSAAALWLDLHHLIEDRNEHAVEIGTCDDDPQFP